MTIRDFVLMMGLLLYSISGHAQTQQQLDNQEAFARLYGYARFFHPSDEAAQIDWDRFAVYGAQQVEAAQNAAELQEILTELFSPFVQGIQIAREGQLLEPNAAPLVPENMKGYDVVTWQHLGVGLNQRGTYKSMRLNRPEIKKAADSWSSTHHAVKAEGYGGKEFRYKAMVKLNPTEEGGRAQMWFRVDRVENNRVFFDNMGNRPIYTTEWAPYEISGTIDEDAESFYFGIMIFGNGSLWMDDAVLEVKEGDHWTTVLHYNFEEGTVGELAEGWSEPKPTEFFTSLVSTEEAYLGTQSLQLSNTTQDEEIPTFPLFDEHAKAGDFIQKPIGAGLQVSMPLALYGNSESTFPQGDPELIAGLLDQMATAVEMPMSGDDRYVRLAAGAITWNVYQHFFPYFDLVELDWNASLGDLIQSAYTDETSNDFLMSLRKHTAPLKDGHINIYLKGDFSHNFIPKLGWTWVGDQLIITGACDGSGKLAAGDVITEIDGMSPQAFFADVQQYISAANASSMKFKSERLALAGLEGSTMQIRVEGKPGVVTLERTQALGEFVTGCGSIQTPTWAELEPDVFYINIDKAPMEVIDSLMPSLKKARGLICDLRGYPNGNQGLIEHLLPRKDTSDSWMQIPQIIHPDQENVVGYSPRSWDLKSKRPHIDCPVIFIIDGMAISYAESYMGYIDAYDLATIVGQPTAGTNGNINPTNLPGNYIMYWTGMRVVRHDGSRFHGIGILPDVPVSRTREGITAGRDEFLDKAMEVLESQMED